MVMPAGDSLVAPSAGGPAQGEGEQGAGDQRGAHLRGQAGQSRGLGDREPDGAEAGRAGLAAAGGHRRVAEGYSQVSVAYRGVVAGSGAAVAGGDGCGGQEPGEAADGVADGDAAELGERGQGGVPAGRVPGAGLALVPSVDVFAGLERFLSRPLLIPVKKKSSLAFRVHPGRY